MDIASLHRSEYGEPPITIASAPGVANLMGAHTEAADGYVLLFGMAKRAYVAVSPRSDHSLRFFASDLNERKRTSIAALRYKKEDRFANHPKGVIHRLQILGADIKGMNVTIASEVPSGIGLGASQAMTVALSGAISALCGFRLSESDIAQLAHFAEHTFSEIHVGLAGFLVSALAKSQTALLVDTHRFDWTHIPLDLNGCSLYGINTHAPSSSSDAENRTRIEECEVCLSFLSGRRHGTSLQDFSVDELSESVGQVPEDARRHCLHLVSENERVLDCVAALRAGDMGRLGRLLSRSHESLRDLYEVSSPEVDWIVKHAQEIDGVHGARLSGGGTGSCALALASKGAIDRIEETLHDYERIFGFHPELLHCSADSGVRIDLREGT